MVSISSSGFQYPQSIFLATQTTFSVTIYFFSGPDYIWHHNNLRIPQQFQFSNKMQIFFQILTYFYFHSIVTGTAKSTKKSFLFVNYIWSNLLLRIQFVSQNPKEFYESYFLGQFISFFTPASRGSSSLKAEWQQVSSGLLYSTRLDSNIAGFKMLWSK